MRYTHIAFDIDGTLMDSRHACLRSLQDMLEAAKGIRPSEEELLFTYALSTRKVLEHFHFSDFSAAQELWHRHYLNYEHTVRPFPGIPELLEELTRRGRILGIITSQSHQDYAAGFAHSPLACRFTTVVRSDDVPEPKPSPLPLLRYMELTGCSPRDILYIGDQEADLLCARQAGVDFAFAAWGTPEGLEAELRLETPEEVLRYI